MTFYFRCTIRWNHLSDLPGRFVASCIADDWEDVDKISWYIVLLIISRILWANQRRWLNEWCFMVEDLIIWCGILWCASTNWYIFLLFCVGGGSLENLKKKNQFLISKVMVKNLQWLEWRNIYDLNGIKVGLYHCKSSYEDTIG